MNKVSTIIRFHRIDQISLLLLAVESLHSQHNCSVTPVIVLQDFDLEAEEKVSREIRDIWYFTQHGDPIITNIRNIEEADIRTKLLNIGLKSHFESGNKFVTFLDYDDILYSNALSVLAKPLAETNAVFSFASIELAHALAFHNYDFIYSLSNPYRGKNKLDLIKDNFCPIHSYMVDTSKLEEAEVFFDEQFTRVEDYEFLLRLAGRYPCDFSNLGKKIGIYYMRNNGLNSTPNKFHLESFEQKKYEWKANQQLLRKAKTNIEVRFYASDF